MRLSEFRQVSRRLPPRRRTFHFFRDRHALLLLALHVGEGRRVSDLKSSRFAGLLRRPVVRDALARLRGRTVSAADLLESWPKRTERYVVTLGKWGGESRDWYREAYQTTRKGYNLVVRVNFNRSHDRDFARLLRSDEWYDAANSGHPVDKDGRNTLAWTRVDLDLSARTALIEEVQSDWVRDAREVHDAVVAGTRARGRRWEGCQDAVDERRVRVYQKHVLAPHMRTWAECALTATIVLLVRELAIERIYYHTYDTGIALKKIDRRWSPPRSLYTDLPRRFAFATTTEPPVFLSDTADGHTGYVLSRLDPRFHVHAWNADTVRLVAPYLE